MLAVCWELDTSGTDPGNFDALGLESLDGNLEAELSGCSGFLYVIMGIFASGSSKCTPKKRLAEGVVVGVIPRR